MQKGLLSGKRSISVAMATFNGARYIEEQLASLAQQRNLPSELIISDDASVDETIAIAERFSKNSPFPVRLHRNAQQLGFRSNFMRAASLCNSALIAFCDQDDSWHRDKLSIATPIFDDPTILFAYHNARIVNADGIVKRTLWRASPEIEVSAPLVNNPWSIILGFTQIFRSSLMKWLPLHSASIDPNKPSEQMAHDQWIPFLASILGKTACISTSLADYRQHTNNTFGWHGDSKLRTFIRKLPHHSTILANMEKACENRIMILRELSTCGSAEESVLFHRGIQYYAGLHAHLDGRRQIYDLNTMTARFGQFRKVWRSDVHGKNMSKAIRNKDLIKDIGIGVVMNSGIRKKISGLS